MLFVVPCFPFFFGHVALGLCWLCLKLMLRKIEPCWVVAASFSAHVMLGQCGATLVYVGTVLGHVVSYIGRMLC